MEQEVRKQAGFTLIELMIVVVIVGILAAIAIPQFIKYQLKSKTSEVSRNIGSLRGLEESFVAKYGEYLVATGVPTGAPSSFKKSWNPGAGSALQAIGFVPSGSLYYQYGVGITITTAGTTGYVVDSVLNSGGTITGGVIPTGGIDIFVSSTGDLDSDAEYGNFYITDLDTQINLFPSMTGETIF